MIEVCTFKVPGIIFYYIKGTKIPHREDGPAVICEDGGKFWYRHGKLHREDGPAKERSDGSKEWYLSGWPHREDGPAIDHFNGGKEWFVNGERHRVDGPALIYEDGTKEWWLNHKRYKKEEWFELLTEEQKVKALYSEYFIGSLI